MKFSMTAYELLVITGPEQGKSFRLENDEIIIGRGSSCQITLNDRTISRHHSKIVRGAEGLVIEDLGSANGTFVNGYQVESSVLKVDDRLTLGNIEMLLRQVASRPLASQQVLLHPRLDDEPTRLHQPSVQQIQTGERSDPTSTMSITHSLSSTELIQHLGRSHATLSAMYRVIQMASSILDLDMLLSRILDETFAIVRAERAFVLLFNTNTDQLEIKASRWLDKDGLDQHVSISQHIVSHVLEKKESVLIADAMADSHFGFATSVVFHKIRSAMCAPLRGRSQIVGIIHVDTSTSSGEFTHDDLMLLDAIGNAAGIAVENAQLYKEKIQNERLAAMGQAISGISHYIKNILSAMETSYSMVEKGLVSEDLGMIGRVWKILRRSNQRITNLVLDMLAYSKDRKPETQPCLVNDICKEVVELCQDRLQTKKVKLHLDLNPQLPFIHADPQGIHRCLLNVLTNSVDALDPGGGEVKMTTVEHGDGEVLIKVHDNGPGIPEEIQGRIFDVFFSTKGSGGTGLGLAVTRKIVEEHGGSITVVSSPAPGTEFTIRLPVGKPQSRREQGGE
ncbi:MAG: ATP-binding protein [Syntrophobacteria bacterium]